MTLHEVEAGETWFSYWQHQNEQDEKELITTGQRKKTLFLYCQSCCHRYPDECLFMDTLHPYDRAAETCPDYVPKDLYKGDTRSKCLLKRLEIEPGYTTLPECNLWHPIYKPFAVCSSHHYYQIKTKEKAYRKLRQKQERFSE